MYGKKKMMKKGGKKKFPDLTGDGKVTRADILKGRGVFRKGGGNEISEEVIRRGDRDKKEEVRKIKRQLDSYIPQTQRKPNQTPPKAVAANSMRDKLEGSAKNFAEVAERARKAKKPR
jgi:hypothetical protein